MKLNLLSQGYPGRGFLVNKNILKHFQVPSLLLTHIYIPSTTFYSDVLTHIKNAQKCSQHTVYSDVQQPLFSVV